MRMFALAVVLVGALLGPASAAAGGTPARRQRAAQPAESARRLQSATATAGRRGPSVLALSIAERYWGATPCGGQIAITAGLEVPSGMSSITDAWVTFDSSAAPNDLTAPAGSYTNCRIGLARWQWPSAATIKTDWGMFCLTVIHEVGHLLGHPHTSVPGSVMAPLFTDESAVPASCRNQTARDSSAGRSPLLWAHATHTGR